MKIKRDHTNNKEMLEYKMNIASMMNEGGSFGIMGYYFNDEANIEKAEQKLDTRERILY